MFSLADQVVQANSFGIEVTFIAFVILVLADVLSPSGAVIGALVSSLISMVVLRPRNVVEIGSLIVSLPQGARPFILGVILILMLILRPSGLTGGREIAWPFRTKAPLPGVPPTNE